MLILTRKPGESITIGANQEVVVRILDYGKRRMGCISVGIEAPKEIPILRTEILERMQRDMGGNVNEGY
jgi:carbon storage regulator CsrA